MPGLYRPPVFKSPMLMLFPPQTIISLPVHTAVWWDRATGAAVMLVTVQLSVLGLYRAPVFNATPVLPNPPQTIISLPVHTAVWFCRPLGELGGRLVGVHVSSVQAVDGLELSDEPAIPGSV
jgi:hypothetical protein